MDPQTVIDQLTDDNRALQSRVRDLEYENAHLQRQNERLTFQLREQQQDIEELLSVKAALVSTHAEQQLAIASLLRQSFTTH